MRFIPLLFICLTWNSLIFASGTMETKSRKDLTSDAQKSISLIFQAYEELMMSFFDYDIAKIAKSKTSVLEKLKSAIASSLKIDPALKSKLLEAETVLVKISDQKDASKERNYEAYHSFSKVLVNILETYALGSTYNVYYCPMVKKKWVQNSQKRKKVHNPYAPEMPHCGAQITEF